MNTYKNYYYEKYSTEPVTLNKIEKTITLKPKTGTSTSMLISDIFPNITPVHVGISFLGINDTGDSSMYNISIDNESVNYQKNSYGLTENVNVTVFALY